MALFAWAGLHMPCKSRGRVTEEFQLLLLEQRCCCNPLPFPRATLVSSFYGNPILPESCCRYLWALPCLTPFGLHCVGITLKNKFPARRVDRDKPDNKNLTLLQRARRIFSQLLCEKRRFQTRSCNGFRSLFSLAYVFCKPFTHNSLCLICFVIFLCLSFIHLLIINELIHTRLVQ